MSNYIVPVDQIQIMAQAVAKSNLFGVQTADQAMALMLIAQAEGMHPAIAARDYHIIKGRPALKADALLARFQMAGGKVEWKDYADDMVTGVFSHPAGGSLSVTWTIAQAKNIGLVRPDSGWVKYPRAMLRSRCISEGIRAVYPSCAVGTYTVEEVQDFEDKPSKAHAPEVKNMGAAEIVEEINTTKDITPEVLEKMKAEGKAFLPLYIPDQEEPYATAGNLAGWEISFHDLVARIKGSNKLSDDAKRDKLKRLKDVNGEVIDTLDTVTKMKVVAAANSLEAI